MALVSGPCHLVHDSCVGDIQGVLDSWLWPEPAALSDADIWGNNHWVGDCFLNPPIAPPSCAPPSPLPFPLLCPNRLCHYGILSR